MSELAVDLYEVSFYEAEIIKFKRLRGSAKLLLLLIHMVVGHRAYLDVRMLERLVIEAIGEKSSQIMSVVDKIVDDKNRVFIKDIQDFRDYCSVKIAVLEGMLS